MLFLTAGDRANLTRWKRQDALKVEDLREIYRKVTGNIRAGQTSYVNLDELERQSKSTFSKQMDGTAVRVAISLLEKVELIARHFDAPRQVWIGLTEAGARERDADFMRFRKVAYLPAGRQSAVDVGPVSLELGSTPDELERNLLLWQERGLLTMKGSRREPVIERLLPPRDVAQAINDLLARRDEAQNRQIDQMIEYATANRCRHRMLAAHLGEGIENCGTSCDHCAPRSNRAVQEKKVEAQELPGNVGQTILECLTSFPFRPGKPSIVKALMGSAASNVTSGRVRHFGTMAGAVKSSLEAAIDSLVEQNYIETVKTEEGYILLRATAKAEDGVPAGAITVKPKKEPKPKQEERETRPEPRWERGDARPYTRTLIQEAQVEEAPPTQEETDLFERLRAWRKVAANRLNVAPFVIMHDKTLWGIARARPRNEEELLAVKGIGQSHLQKYSDDILSLVAE